MLKIQNLLVLLLVGVASGSIAAEATPTPEVSIYDVREAIEGRTVSCFFIASDIVPAASFTVTVAFGGTATNQTDFTASTTVTIPKDLPTDKAIFLPITAVVDGDADLETIVCTIQPGSGYNISGTETSATTHIRTALNDDAVSILGEPATISTVAGQVWSYTARIARPDQLPMVTGLPVEVFSMSIEAAPGLSAIPTWLTLSAPPLDGQTNVPFTVAGSPPSAGQYRFRLTAKVDVDGDQSYVPPGQAVGGGRVSDDIFVTQDIVLIVTDTSG